MSAAVGAGRVRGTRRRARPARADVGQTRAVVEGRVTRGGEAVPVGYARLLNEGGDFVAESAAGHRRRIPLLSRPRASWTVRVLGPRRGEHRPAGNRGDRPGGRGGGQRLRRRLLIGT